MALISSFVDFMQPLAVTMTAPTWINFQMIVTGWVFASRRTITGMIEAAGQNGVRHHSLFHRIFAAAAWSLDELGLAVFDRIAPWCDDVIFLSVDDTLAHKRGLKVFGAEMHYDPLISSRGKKLTRWGHNWVVLCVVIRFPLWPDRPFSLPILFRLYLNTRSAKKHQRKYRPRPELAVEMLELICKHCPDRRFHLLADSAYGGKSVLGRLPANCDLTSRLVLNARLYEAPSERKPGTRGRTRKRGKQLPAPKEMLKGRGRRIDLTIYGRSTRMRVVDCVARVFKVPDRDLRVVTTEALEGGRGREAFFSTCHQALPEEILQWYADRWSIEVTFHDSKQYLGFEEPQGWSPRAVKRTAPVAMLLYTLIVTWFATVGGENFRRPDRPWYRRERDPSFRDMLAWLRRESMHQTISQLGLSGRGSKKVIKTLERIVQLAV